MNAHNTIFNSYLRPVTQTPPDNRVEATASTSWLARVRAALNTWSAAAADSRSESRLWDIAMSDPRVMAKLIQGRQRDDGEGMEIHPQSAPVLVKSAVPALTDPKAQGLGVLLERVYQSRQRHNMPVATS